MELMQIDLQLAQTGYGYWATDRGGIGILVMLMQTMVLSISVHQRMFGQILIRLILILHP
jgi:hypothetical protein